MGALHEGHISLIVEAKSACNTVVCSIFVNPTQFNNTKDFEEYPNTITSDIDLLETADCDILYLPTVADIYDTGIQDLKQYDLGYIETIYDGAFRPGHFQGVCNVVERLFRAVTPHQAFFGLKDYQQCMVINKLVTLMQWQEKITIVLCQTLREKDGLAMSSRNMRLNETQRETAPMIYQSLQYIQQNLNNKPIHTLTADAIAMLSQKGFVPDYVDIADAQTLTPVQVWNGEQKLVCLVAAFLGEIRLIDNMQLN